MIDGIVDNPISRLLIAIGVTGIIMSIIIGLLPVLAMPAGMEGSISWIFEKLWEFDFMIPVNVLIRCFYIWITLEITILGLNIVAWVWNQVTDTNT